MSDLKPHRKQKHKEPKSHPTQNGTERLKTVVRRLPPNLPEDVFWQSVQAWVTDETVTWKSYHPGKFRTKRANKEGIPSRAYIAFKNEAQVAHFSREYDGHLFRDKAGNESHAVVEYAPFQKVPTEKKKSDARNNTIDKDEDYLSFLETLKSAKPESVSLEALIAASQPPPPPTTTPLLEALKAEKSAQKDKEAILRNHAHYKDVITGSASKKEEGKKKAGNVVAPAAVVGAQQAVKPEPSVSPASTNKKAKKAAAAAAAAAQKTALAQVPANEGQGGGVAKGAAAATALAAGTSAGTGAAPSSAKHPSTPARHRPPKEPHGRSSGKGETGPMFAPGPMPMPGPIVASPLPLTLGAMTMDGVIPSAPASSAQGYAQGQGHRKNRPVVGLGRQFEAALNGTGVGIGALPGDRKRRDRDKDKDRGGESGAGGPSHGEANPSHGGKSGKQRHGHREERGQALPPPPSEVVPSILQRPMEGQGGAETMSVQRPLMEGGGAGAAAVGPGSGPGGSGMRGGGRRGRGRGRGRGG